MIFASVAPGHYLIIENDVVAGEVKRRYDNVGSYWNAIGYDLTWRGHRMGRVEFFRNLPKLHLKHPMENYPGYGRVLNADKKTIRRKRRRDWFMGAK